MLVKSIISCLPLYLLIFMGLIPAVPVQGQPHMGQKASSGPEMLLQVLTDQAPARFISGDDFHAPKVLPSYYQLHISSGGPWMVTAASMASTGTSPMVDLKAIAHVSLRNRATGQVIRLSGAPQVVLLSNNQFRENDYGFDLIIDPPFDIPQGDYRGSVSFELSPQ